MPDSTRQADLWDNEYLNAQSIPSSTRTAPSHALRLAVSLIDLPSTSNVLDAGCGNGRNAVYLASRGHRVTAIDFSEAALKATSEHARRERLSQQIEVQHVDLLADLPHSSGRFNLVLDSYVSCHILDPINFKAYWNELARVTTPGGLIYTSMFCDDDEFYAGHRQPSHGNTKQALDPANQIVKSLYSESEFKALFQAPLRMKYFVKFQFTDVVSYRPYLRSLLIALLEKTVEHAHDR